MIKIKVRNIGKPIQLGEEYLDTGESREVEVTDYVKMHMSTGRLVEEESFKKFLSNSLKEVKK